MTAGTTVEINAADIEVPTTPGEVETYLVDGIKGVAIVNGVARINFIETYLDSLESVVKGRHVVTLAIPMDTLAAILELLNNVASKVGMQGPIQTETTPQTDG